MHKLRILVADDNPLSLRFLAESLRAIGHTVAEAADGTRALASTREAEFDLLLLDARMPGLGGIDVLARVRSGSGPSQHASAIATTADDDPAAHAALREAGFADVWLKPIGVDDLRAALATHIAEHGPGCDTLDDRQALSSAGGDAAIVAALRRMLSNELNALPIEFASFSERTDADAIRERLHRLDASAGFCGAPALVEAAAALRQALARSEWPQAQINRFLSVCARTRAQLVLGP